MQGAVPIPKAKLDAIENIAKPVEKEIMRLSQVHRIDTSKGSQYFFYRQRGFSDLAAKYLIYSEKGIIAPHPSQVTPTRQDNVTGVQPLDIDESYFDTLPPEKKEGGVFYKNYKTGYEVGRLDRLSGETSESVATIVSYPGGADGYRDGKSGRPMKDPMTYFATKLREMINESNESGSPIWYQRSKDGSVAYVYRINTTGDVGGEAYQYRIYNDYRKEIKRGVEPSLPQAKKVVFNFFENPQPQQINEEVTKAEKDDILKEVEKMVRKELSGKASKKVMNDIIKEAITNLYRTLWLRRATWLSGI